MSAQAAPVVVGYDASESARRAVVWAAEEAAQRGRALTVVSAVDYASLGLRGPASMARLWVRDARERVALMACEGAELARGSVPGLVVRPIGEVGRPARILVEESSTASVLVVGTRAHTSVSGMAVGCVAHYVATLAHCPVVVVRLRTTAHPGPYHPVVVGVDGSRAALLALDASACVAEAAGAALMIVAAWMRPAIAAHDAYSGASDLDPQPSGMAGAQVALDTAVARVRGVHPYLEVGGIEVEEPAAAALAAQSAHAGLLVVGSRGRGAVRALVLGSVSHLLAQTAPCPVAVVGPHAVASASEAAPGAGEECPLQALR